MKSTFSFNRPTFDVKLKIRIVGLIGLISVGTLVGGLIVDSYPTTQSDTKTSVTILTYNIQQGNTEDGIKNFDGQLRVIREVDPDIIGLQESDPARIAGGNSDVVRYIANNLNLYSYYGPKTVTGTFGIALLSKYPIKNAKTFYMYSFEEWEHKREQTACIEAEITIGTKLFTVFVTHLANGSPLVQQQEILQRVGGKSNVILMGDFNFKPSSDQYNITTEILYDCWEEATNKNIEEIPDGSDPIPEERIDHIFVSYELRTNVTDCTFLGGSNSDHPALSVIIDW